MLSRMPWPAPAPDPRSILTAAEEAELRRLHRDWTAARDAKDYATADRLRTELAEWGATSPSYTRWSAAFESSAHRERRLAARAR